MLIGKKLIVEVEGKVHDKDFQKSPDRIRQRALENMGYSVLRVKSAERSYNNQLWRFIYAKRTFWLKGTRLRQKMLPY